MSLFILKIDTYIFYLHTWRESVLWFWFNSFGGYISWVNYFWKVFPMRVWGDNHFLNNFLCSLMEGTQNKVNQGYKYNPKGWVPIPPVIPVLAFEETGRPVAGLVHNRDRLSFNVTCFVLWGYNNTVEGQDVLLSSWLVWYLICGYPDTNNIHCPMEQDKFY